MTTDATPAAPQAGGTGDTSTQAVTQTTPEPQAGDGQEPISLDEAKKLRSEANNLRKRLKAFEDAQAQAEAAKLTEQERLAKHAADLQSKYDSDTAALTERIVSYEIQLQAAALNADPKYLDKIARLIDVSEIEFNDDGAPTNVKALVEKLFKEVPVLQRQDGKPVPSSGGATNPSRSAAATSGLSWDVISKMTSEQYNARRSEIQQWMTSNPPKRF